jgi:hypothetical protein
VTVDGLDIGDETHGSVAQNLSQEAVHEFQVSRSALDITTGVTASGAVNVVTRSGTNEVRGSAFFLWRDDAFAARVGEQKQPFDREQVGFSLGGPFIRDRLFWFTSYERNNQDAATATEIPVFPQYSSVWPLPFDERMAIARLDWNVAAGLRAFFRFTHNWNEGISPRTLGGQSLSPNLNLSNASQVAVGVDAAVGRFTHSVRYGHMNFDNLGDIAPERIPGLPETVDPAGRILTVNFGAARVGAFQNAPNRRFMDSDELRYDGGVSLGRHIFRWGVLINIIRANWFESISAHAPTINVRLDSLTQQACGSDPLCYPVSNAQIGNGMGFWTEIPSHGLPYGGLKNDRFHWYAADSWRIAPGLTANFGIRWVYEPGPSNPDLVKPAIYDAIQPGLSARNRADKNNFAPQLGLAWDPTGSGKWVVRAGAGIFYDANLLKHIIFERIQAMPLGITQEQVNVAGQVLRDPNTNRVIFDLNGRDLTALITPGVNWVGKPLGFAGTPGPPPGGTFGTSLIDAILAAQAAFQAAYQIAFDSFPSGPSRCELRRQGCVTFGQGYATPYTFQFNVGVQRELRPGLVVSVDYVRHRGVHLHGVRDQNRLGAADTLSIANALAAMNTTFGRFTSGGVRCNNTTAFPTLGQRVDCTIAAGANIAAYAGQGLGFVQTASSTQLNASAFPGTNPAFNRMQGSTFGGLSGYNALQAQLRGALPNVGRAVRDWSVLASYSLSRLEVAGAWEDPAVLLFGNTFFHDNPLGFRGPANLDRTHMLSLGTWFTIPGGVRLNSIWRAFTALPLTVTVPLASTAAGEIFFTDFNGDGFGGDPLPGTNRGSYGRGLGCGAQDLNRAIAAYNSTKAGQLTPASQALVDAALFSEPQLRALGAVSPTIALAPSGQVCLDSFITTDVRIARPFKLRGERITIEPAFEWFNLFNVANYDLPNSTLSGVLNGTVGSVNGTTPANRPNRAEFTGGSFALGTPRSWQVVIRVLF